MREMTLADARAWLEQHKEEGVKCPCCRQFAKIYKRKLNSAMARDLIWLCKRFLVTKDWVDIPLTGPINLQRSRELAKLVHWKLIENKSEESKRGAKISGLWRPTQQGMLFAANNISLPKYVRLYDGQIVSFPDDGTTTVSEALGDHFDYQELWGESVLE